MLVVVDYLSDVTFTLGNQHEELKAHKFFLMTASPIFHEIFSTAGTADGLPLDLKISEISKATMTEICRFAYTENVNFNQHNMIEIMQAAIKLQMKFLTEKAINYITKDGLNEQSVFKILDVNQKEKNMLLNMKCFDYIQKHHQKCFKSSEFLQMSPDSLRLMLQTCKLPLTVAKSAIALWSAHADNASEDLDELVALISLNDYSDEAFNHGGSDSESIGSQQSSRADLSIGGNRQRNRRGAGQQQNFNNPQQSRMFQNQNQGNFNPNQHPGNGQQQQQRRMGPHPGGRGGHQQQRPNENRNQPMRNQQQQPVSNSSKNFVLQGRTARKSFQYANLNLKSLNQPIAINEIFFIYDLSTTDPEFDIYICDMTDNRKDLFYCKVSTRDHKGQPLTHYVLPRPCEIGSDRKIWISIEFLRQEHRLSFDNFAVSGSTSKDRLALRGDPNINNHAQVISNIGFDDVAA